MMFTPREVQMVAGRFVTSRHAAVGGAVALLLAVGLSSSACGPRDQTPPTVAAVFPGAEWARIADPESVGFCQAGLDDVTAHAETLTTTGAVAIVGGRVLWEYGDLTTVSYLASVRKSILAMLYGKYVDSGQVDLDATLAELNITDHEGLLDSELDATVFDLLTARSGVYHPAANAASAAGGSTVGEAPERGTVPHGTYFLYNNWDFNALGTIFEQETGLGIYEAFERDLVEPLGLREFDRDRHRRNGNANRSQHLAYHFHLSTRDMARIGYVMLRQGEWDGRSVIAPEWVHRIVQPVTPVAEMNPSSYRQGPFGYGMLWWIWDGPWNDGIYRGAYTGIGAIGQYITVLPALDMVVAHKTRPGGDAVSRSDYLGILDRLGAARCLP
jgi:CubicO group peptidase (beta-lactamase class C family)